MRVSLDVQRLHTSGSQEPLLGVVDSLNVWRVDHRVNQRFPEPCQRSPDDVIAGNRPTERCHDQATRHRSH